MPRPRKERKERIEPEKPYIGTKTAAEILGVSRQRVDQLIRDDVFDSAYQIDEPGGAWVILRSEVEKFKQNK